MNPFSRNPERNFFSYVLAVIFVAVFLFPARVAAQLDCADGCLLGDLVANDESIEVGELRFDNFSVFLAPGDPVDADAILVRPFSRFWGVSGLEFNFHNALNLGVASLDVTIAYRVSTIDNRARIAGALLYATADFPGETPEGNLQVSEALAQVSGKNLLEQDASLAAIRIVQTDSFIFRPGGVDTATFSREQSVVVSSTVRLSVFDITNPAFPRINEMFFLVDDEASDCKSTETDDIQLCSLTSREEPRGAPELRDGGGVNFLTQNLDTNNFVAHAAVPLDNGSGVDYFGIRTSLTAEQVPRVGPSGNEIIPSFSNFNARDWIAVVLTEIDEILGVISSSVRLIDLNTGNFLDIARRGEPLQTPQGGFDIFEALGVALTENQAIITAEEESNDPQQRFGTVVLDISDAFTDGSVTPLEAYTSGRAIETDRGQVRLPGLVLGSLGNAESGSWLLNTVDFSTNDQKLLLVDPGRTVRVIGQPGDPVDSGESISSPGSASSVNAAGDVATIAQLTQDPNDPLAPRRQAAIVSDAATGELRLILGQGDPVPGREELGVDSLSAVAINQQQGVVSFTTRDAQGQSGPQLSLPFSFGGDRIEFGEPLFPPGTSFTLSGGSVFEIASGLGIGAHSVGSLAAEVTGADGTQAVLISTLPLIPLLINIDTPADGSITSASAVDVGGTVGDDRATVTVNGLPAIVSGGSFLAQAVPLAEGSNTITALAEDTPGNTASDSITVISDTTQPDLTIDLPPDGATVDLPSVQVIGFVSDANLDEVRVAVFDASGAQVGDVAATASFGTYFAPVLLAEGANRIVVTATDLAANTTTVSRDVIRQTATTNLPPTITSVPPNAAQTGVTYTYIVDATDPDPGDSLVFSLDEAPAGMTIDQATGVIRWTPASDQAGPNGVVVRVTDEGGLFDRQGFTVLVSDLTPPVIDIDAPLDGAVLANLGVDVTGTVDDDSATVTVNGIAATVSGNSFLARNVPLAEGPNTITATAVDPAGNSASTSITVIRDTTPPDLTIDSPANGATVELPAAQVVGTVSDANLESVRVVVFDAEETQVSEAVATVSGGTYFATVPIVEGDNQVRVIATDLSGNQVFIFHEITGRAPVTNVAPTIISVPINSAQAGVLYTYDVEATDPDPGDGLTFSLDEAPSGMTIDPASGLIQWTPAGNQLGPNGVVARVTDDGGLFDRQGFTVLVSDLTPPVIDIDAPLDGAFTFRTQVDVTGTVDDDSATVTVNGIPATVSGNSFLAQNVPLALGDNVITAIAVDPAGNSASTSITVTRDPEPLFVTIESPDIDSIVDLPSVQVVGTVTGANLAEVRVTVLDDNGTQVGEVVATVSGESFTATVPIVVGRNRIFAVATGLAGNRATAFTIITGRRPVTNVAPVLDPIGNQSVDEGSLLSFTASASDDDLGDTLIFSLDTGAPVGASIDPTTGLFSWTPGETDGGTTASVTVRVTDDGTPVLDDNETITITVNEVNDPPLLDPIGNRSVDAGSTLSFTATASDTDLPPNALTFSLDTGAPVGASIDPDTGLFSWTPGAADGGTTASVTVRVTDDGTPVLDDAETISITVNDVPVTPRRGDTDGDGDVDRDDISLILAARNQPAEANDPRDLDSDGVITVLDARRAVLLCDRPACATE